MLKEGESIILTFNNQRIEIILSEAKNGQAQITIEKRGQSTINTNILKLLYWKLPCSYTIIF